jgi:ADP-ribose pyrophosphatase YjhB (NUDIX family)
MVKVFSQNKIIYFIDSQKLYISEQDTILVSIQSQDEMRLMFDELVNKNNLTEIYFFNKDIKLLFSYFKSMFRFIEAAGGLVKNNKNEWLFIFRNGKWDLPKGKVEKNEAINDAAIREVEEECGVTSLSIIRELPSTYHTYFMEEKAILKRTYWFEMFCNDLSVLLPQLEEGITDVKWLSESKFNQVKENTYVSVMEVMKEINNQ